MSGTETEAFHDAIPSVDLSAVYEDEESDGEVASRPACTLRPLLVPTEGGLSSVCNRGASRASFGLWGESHTL